MLLVFFLVTTGCAERDSGPPNLVGTFVLDSSSQTRLQQYGYSPRPKQETQIVMDQSGRIILTAIPDQWRLGTSKGKLEDADGTYSVSESEINGRKLLLDLNWKNGAHEGSELDLSGSGQSTSLRMWVGDPDSGHLFDFVRADAPK
jgi:hypothetical protein